MSKFEGADSILSQFQQLRIWRAGGYRAPHKPLLVLLAIGRCMQNREKLTSYIEMKDELNSLLTEYGPFRKNFHPQHPFWRLRNDGVWEIDRPHLVRTTSRGDATPRSLKRHNIRGGFTDEIDKLFRKNHDVAMSVAIMLLHSHFPVTLHEEILRATGIMEALLESEPTAVKDVAPEYVTSRRLKREEGFRRIILDAYENQCAVCEFSVKLKGSPLALEAAHIKWHQASGPSEPNNGLLLCSLHHKLFDKGVFTLLPKEFKVIVAEDVAATDPGYEDALGKFHEKRLSFVPRKEDDQPAMHFIKWHTREVFKSRGQLPLS